LDNIIKSNTKTYKRLMNKKTEFGYSKEKVLKDVYLLKTSQAFTNKNFIL